MHTHSGKAKSMKRRSTLEVFKDITKKARSGQSPRAQAGTRSARYVQARLFDDDYRRLRRAAFDADLSVQDALIEAINLWLEKKGEPPARNPGTSRPKSFANEFMHA